MAIKKEQAVDGKVADTIAKHKEELAQVDSFAYQAGQKKAAKYYATGQVKEITNDICVNGYQGVFKEGFGVGYNYGLDAAQVLRDAPRRQIPEALIPDVPISPSAKEEPTEESTEHVEDDSNPPAAA